MSVYSDHADGEENTMRWSDGEERDTLTGQRDHHSGTALHTHLPPANPNVPNVINKTRRTDRGCGPGWSCQGLKDRGLGLILWHMSSIVGAFEGREGHGDAAVVFRSSGK